MPKRPAVKVTRTKYGRTRTEDIPEPPAAPPDADDLKFMALCRSRFEECIEREAKIREKSLDDLKFKIGGNFQWPDNAIQQRTIDKKPIITINRIKPAVRQVTNDQRQNRPSIKVNPVDDHADVDTARILQGIIRHIEVNSMADIAYDWASDNQVTHGFGYIGVKTQYASPFSFDQEIIIYPIKDSFSVYFGPYTEDGEVDYAFQPRDLDRDTYIRSYSKSKFASAEEFTGMGNAAPKWGHSNDMARVVDYYYREYEPTTLVLLSNGEVMPKDKYDEIIATMPPEMQAQMAQVDTRESLIPKVHMCTTNGSEKLEESDWAGRYIPIVQVLGEEAIVDGERHLYGIVRDAKDSQRMYNYHSSTMVEVIAQTPNSPIIAEEGQLENYEDQWKAMGTRRFAYLKYKGRSIQGHLVPAPRREQSEPAIQAITIAIDRSESDIKASTQVFDAKLGNRSNETSGTAIKARQSQGDTANYNYLDNFTRSIRVLGRILLDLIPHIYDARTVARIIGEDGMASRVPIMNDPNQPAKVEVKDELTGKIKNIYNIGIGVYDIALGVGPGYMTKRQEAFDMMTKMVNSQPELMTVAGDLIFANSDIPGAQQLSERLKKALPPNLQDAPDGETPIPPQVKQQMDQMAQQNEMLTKAVQEMQDLIKTKQIEQQGHMQLEQGKAQSQAQLKQLELQNQLQIEQMKLQAQAQLEQIKLQSELQLKQIEAQMQQAELASKERIAALNAQVKMNDTEVKADTEVMKSETSRLQAEVKEFQKPGTVEGDGE